jgi:hypothetical protein
MLFRLCGLNVSALAMLSVTIWRQVKAAIRSLVVRVSGQGAVRIELCPTVLDSKHDNGAELGVAWGVVGNFVSFIH